MKSEDLNIIIDVLAPINNAFRREKNTIKKVEYVWELGSLLEKYVHQYNVRLDDLLLSIYDPHATIKRSNITRSLGSYSSRVFRFFKHKEEIRKTLPQLQSYNVFREALPLLVNEKYVPHVDRSIIINLINSGKPSQKIINELISIKQSILPIKNPRTSLANMYIEERYQLNDLMKYIKRLYSSFGSIFEFNKLEYNLSDQNYRDQLVSILMALASDAFLNKLNNISKIDVNVKRMFDIAKSNSENRSRFRKWVFSANDLLWLAEGVHALNNEDDFRYFKKKLEK